MTRGRIAAAVLLAALVLAAGEAVAQTQRPSPAAGGSRPRPPFRPGSIEVDGGVLWLGGIDFGSPTAAITANRSPPDEYPLFRTASELRAGPTYEGRFGVRITRMLGVEGSFQFFESFGASATRSLLSSQ